MPRLKQKQLTNLAGVIWKIKYECWVEIKHGIVTIPITLDTQMNNPKYLIIVETRNGQYAILMTERNIRFMDIANDLVYGYRSLGKEPYELPHKLGPIKYFKDILVSDDADLKKFCVEYKPKF